MHADESYILRALGAGAKGYLLKESTETDVLPAVQSVRDGKPYFTPSIARLLLEDYMRTLKQNNLQDSYDLLTEREREVLQLLAQGKSNKEVAQVLDLSPHTIDSHRTNMMQKLNLHNTAEIVLYAVRKGIIVP
jgi:DNA-binding NarL/FixJ family response regulator